MFMQVVLNNAILYVPTFGYLECYLNFDPQMQMDSVSYYEGEGFELFDRCLSPGRVWT